MFLFSTILNAPLLAAKLWSTLGVLVVSVICSYMPWGIRSHYKNSKTLMSYLNCLAGGVVLGALMMHMIPEITHSHYNVPPATLLSTCPHGHHRLDAAHAHLVSFPLDKLHEHDHDHDHHNHGHGCGDCEHGHHDHKPHKDNHGNTPQNQGLANKDGKKQPDTLKEDHNHDGCGHDHQQHGFAWGLFFAGASFLFLLAIDRLFMHSHSQSHDHKVHDGEHPVMAEKRITDDTNPNTSSTNSPHHHHLHAQCGDVECGGKVHSADPEDDDCASCHSDDLVGGCHMDGLDARSSRAQALVFVIALSMHSFLEGLGMASKNTQRGLTLYLISLFAHKWLEAFALGVNVMNAAFTNAYAFTLVTFYSLLTPIGILLGIFFEYVTLNGPYGEMAGQCMNGLAVGSFMFVSCIEMIPPEFHKKTSHTPYKFMALVLGFVLMAVISAFHYH